MTFVCISGPAHFLFIDEGIEVKTALDAAQAWYAGNNKDVAPAEGDRINVVECFVRDRAKCADSAVDGFGTVHTCKWTPQKWIDGLNDERVAEHLQQGGVLLLAAIDPSKEYLQEFLEKMAHLGQRPQLISVMPALDAN